MVLRAFQQLEIQNFKVSNTGLHQIRLGCSFKYCKGNFCNIWPYRRKQGSYSFPANDENNYRPKKLNSGLQHLEYFRGL